MTLDHPAWWSMYASLEELRRKIGHVVKCSFQKSKLAWSNLPAKRCRERLNSSCILQVRDAGDLIADQPLIRNAVVGFFIVSWATLRGV